ncbi:MAG: argininosuccinate lyase [Candidatus Brocadiae bacterium]|nr:argininosuccinate lyase [Candidatus Brocadiia bacterium]
MGRLWDKGQSIDALTQRYCAGIDWRLDQDLLPFDIQASAGHAKGLAELGVLSRKDLSKLRKALAELTSRWEAGTFRTTEEDEDGHTAIELALTRSLGDLGKKIHTARSRNDQVGAALRLYALDRLGAVSDAALDLAQACLQLARHWEKVPMPGYSHTRRAMLSSAGTWAGAFADQLADDLALLAAGYALADRSPLGSAAGYGVPLPIDRESVAAAAGFSGIQDNVLAVQNARGRIEAVILSALSYLMLTVNRFCNDIVWFSSEEFGFFVLPARFTTGSSIMPQKKNPDVFELSRGAYAFVSACEHQVRETLLSLPSGYNRDTQLTKEPFMRGMAHAHATLAVLAHVVPHLEVDEKRCRAACTADLFATDEALRRVSAGVPWRDAYRQVAEQAGTWKVPDLDVALRLRSHAGGPGNLQLGKLAGRLARLRREWARR